METTSERTVRFVIAVCLVAVVGGIVGAVAADGVGVVSAETDETVDDISLDFDPESANPRDDVEITATLENESEPVSGVEADFQIIEGNGTLSESTATSDSDGIARTTYDPTVDEIGDTVTILVETASEDTFDQFAVEASADDFREETATPAVVDPGNTTDIAARVFDERDKPFGDAAVSVEVETGSGQLSGLEPTSDADGWVNATYEAVDDDADRTVELNISADETPATTTIEIDVTANVDAFDPVSVEPADPAADDNVTLSARVRDEAGEPLGNATVDVEADGNGSLSPPTVESNATGWLNTTYTPVRADNDTTVTLTLGVGTDGERTESVGFDPVTISSFESPVADPEAAEPGENTTVTAVARDEFNETVSNRPVDIEATGEGELNTTTTETDSDGQLAVRYASAIDDTGTEIEITITASDTDAETTVSVPVVASPDSMGPLSAEPETQDPGEPVDVSTTVFDEAGDPLDDASVSFEANAVGVDAGTFTNETVISDDGDVATTFTPNGSAAGLTVTLNATADGTQVSNETELNVTANPAEVLPEPATTDPIDPGNSTNVSAQIRDESGTPVSNATVSFGTNGTGGLDVERNNSDSDGWVNASYTAADDDAGADIEVDVTVEATGAVGTVTVPVVANADGFENATVEPSEPEPNETAAVELQAVDEAGQPLAGAGVELSADGNSSLEDVTTESGDDGWITATYTPTAGDANTTVEIEVTANETDAATTLSVSVGELAAETVDRTRVDPAEIDPRSTGTQVNETTVGVRVLDQVGDELPDAEIEFTTDDAGTLNTTSRNTTSDGWANVTYSAVDADAGQAVEITADAVDRELSETLTVSVTANAGDIVAPTAVAGAEPNEPIDLNATVEDEAGDPIGGSVVNISTNGSEPLETQVTSDSDGLVEASDEPVREDANETLSVAFEAANTSAAAETTVEIPPLAATAINETAVADAAVDPGNTTELNATVYDQFDQPLANATVDFETAENGTVEALESTSTESGLVNASYTAADADANTTDTVVINASAEDREAAATVEIAVTANPTAITDVTADEAKPEPNEQTTVTATVRDEADQPLAGAEVEFTTNGSADLQATQTTADGDGAVSATYTPDSDDADELVDIGIAATKNSSVVGNTTLDVGPRAASGITAEAAEPGEIDPVGGPDRTNESTVSAQLEDQFGNALADAPVEFDHDGNGSLNGVDATNETGWVNATYTAVPDDTATTPAITINATDRDVEATVTVDVTANPDSFQNITTDVPADPSEPVEIKAVVLDERGTELPDKRIEFDSDGDGSFDPDDPESDDSGVVETSYEPARTDANRTVAVELESATTALNETVEIDLSPLSADRFGEESADPTEVDPGNETELAARVLDEFGEPYEGTQTGEADGAAVTFTDDGNGSLTDEEPTSDDGWVNATYEAVAADADTEPTVTVDANATDAQTEITFEVAANPVEIANQTVEPAEPEPDEETTVAHRLFDESGDPLADGAVGVSVKTGNGTLDAPDDSGDDGWLNATYTPNGSDANTTVEIALAADETDANTTAAFDVSGLAAETVDQTVVDPDPVDPVEAENRTNETTVGVQVLDQVGDELGDAEINVTTDGAGSLDPSSNITTISEGWANVTYSAVDADAGRTVEVTADAVGRELTETVDVAVTANADRLTHPSAAAGDAADDPVDLSATVLDEAGDELSDAQIAITTNGSGSVDETPTMSDDGDVETSYKPVGEDATETLEVAFNATNTTAANVTTVEIPARSASKINETTVTDAEVDPGNTTEVTATVRDEFGQPFEGSTVSFEGDRNGTFTEVENTSDADGEVTATYEAADADANTTETITVTTNGVSSTVAVDVTATPTAFTEPIVEPSEPEPNESADIALQLLDESDSTLAGETVEIQNESANGTLADTTLTSNGAGWLNTSYTPNGSDADTEVRLNVTAVDTSANTTISFDVDERAAETVENASADPPTVDPVAVGERENETTVSARLFDQVGDPLADAAVGFEIDAGNGTLIETDDTSNTTGVAEATYRAAPADANTTSRITINATDRDAEATVELPVTANPTTFTNRTVEPSEPEPNESADIGTRLRDESGTPLGGEGVELTVDGNGSLASVPATSNGDGWVNASYTPNGSAANTTVGITVEANETDANTTISVAVDERAADGFENVSAAPEAIDPVAVGDRENETTVSARLLDQVGEPLADAPVEITADGNGTLTGADSESNATGIVEASYEATRTDANRTVTVTINATGRNATATQSVPVVANADAIVDASANATVDPGDTVTVTATVLDEDGAPVGGQNVTVTTTNGSATVEPVVNTSLDDGTVEAAYTTVEADANETVGFEVDADATNASATTAVSVNRIGIDAFTNQSLDPAAPEPGDNVSVSLQALDSLDRPIANESVSYGTDGNGTLTQTTPESQQNGTVEATYAVDKTDANETVTVEIESDETDANTTVELPVEPLAVERFETQLTQPSTVDPVDGDGDDDDRNKTANLSVRGLDQVGDPLGGQAVEYTVTNGSGTITSQPTTTGDGWANTTYRADRDATNTTVEIAANATAGDAETTLSVDVRANPDAVTDVVIPDEVDPGDNETVSLTVEDEAGEPFEGAEIAFTDSDETDSDIVPANVTSDADGHVESTLTVADDDAGTTAQFLIIDENSYIIEFETIGVTESVTAFENVTIEPSPLEPNESVTVTADVLNEAGERFDDGGVEFTHDGAGRITPIIATSSSDTPVEATYDPDRTDADSSVALTLAGEETATERNVSVPVAPLSPVDITNGTATPPLIEPGETTLINATVRDQLDEPLEDSAVEFEFDGTGDLTVQNGTSQANGSVAATFRPTAEQNATISIDAVDGAGSETVDIHVLELEPTSFESTAVTPEPATANNEATLQVRVLDQLDQPYPDGNITFSHDGNGTLGETNATSDADGELSTTYTPAVSDIDETVTVTVDSVNGTATTTLGFEVRPTPQAITNASAEPFTVEPGEPTTMSATVRDERDKRLGGADVTFEHNGTASVDPEVATSSANGTVETTYTPLSESNGTVTVTADETGVSSSAKINVTDLEARSLTDVTVDPNPVERGDTATVSATVRDQLDDPFANTTVEFNHTGNGTLSAANDTSSADGEATTTYQSVGEDLDSAVELELSVPGVDNASRLLSVRPQRTSSGSSSSTTRVVVKDSDIGEIEELDTEIRGTSSSIVVEDPLPGEPATLDSETTGLSSLTRTENLSLESVSVTVDENERSYQVDSTSYEYGRLQHAAETQPDAAWVEPFADFEQSTQQRPVGYLRVDATAESVSHVAFEYRLEKSTLDDQGIDPEALTLYRQNGSAWTPLDTAAIRDNETHQWFESHSPGLSLFPIATGQPPTETTAASLETPQVAPDEPATVSVDLEHNGLADTTRELTLTADGEPVETTTVALSAGSTVTADVTFSPPSAGEYDLAVDGREVGTLVVEESATPQSQPRGVIEPVRGVVDGNGLWTTLSVVGVLAVVFVVARRW